MNMNDNTILRIKVPAHLYEAVKAQLTIDEGKQNFGTKDMKPVKGQKAASGGPSDKPKKTSAPKAKAPKKAEAPAAEKKEVPKDGHKKAEKKPRSIEELKAAYEALGQMISEMEDEGKAPVEEGKEEMEEAKDADLKEYEVTYVVRDGKCYRKDDEGNMDQVSMSKCR
jgi:hypothetical protein